MIRVIGEALDDEEIFQARISDHAPQRYQVFEDEDAFGPSLVVVTWNIMGRCRADNIAEITERSNNGYRLNETVPAYEARLFGQILPFVGAWLASPSNGPPTAVCLQELDAHPRTQDLFLEELAKHCGRSIGHVISKVGYEHANISIWAKDDFDTVANAIAVDGDKGLLAIDLTCKASQTQLRLVNAHLPFSGTPEDGSYIDGLESARKSILHCVSTAPLQLVVIAGDFNLDVRHVASGHAFSSQKMGLAHACVDGSAMFEDRLSVLDGCIAGMGLGNVDHNAGEEIDNSGDACLFHGMTRATFITDSIRYNLQSKANLLGDCDLFALGLYHFADQPTKLEELLQKCPRISSTECAPPEEVFYGRSRQEFIEKCVHFNLQSLVDHLSDEDLFTLGRCQFATQPMKLEALTDQAAENEVLDQRLFYGGTRSSFIEKYINHKLKDRVNDLGDEEVFQLGQCDFSAQTARLEYFFDTHCERAVTNLQPPLASCPDTQATHVKASQTIAEDALFHGLSRLGFISRYIHFDLQGQIDELDDNELLALGLCNFGVQSLKLESMLKERAGTLNKLPANTPRESVDQIFNGPSRIAFVEKHINPLLKVEVEALDGDAVFRLARYDHLEQPLKLDHLKPTTSQTLRLDDDEAASGHVSKRDAQTQLFYGLSRAAFIEKSIRYDFKHQVSTLDDNDLFWLGRNKFSAQTEKLEEILSNEGESQAPNRNISMIKMTGVRRGMTQQLAKPQQSNQDAALKKMIPNTHQGSDLHGHIERHDQKSEAKDILLKGLSRSAYIQKYIHYKLQNKVESLSDADLSELGRCHYGEQHATLNGLLVHPIDVSNSLRITTGHDLPRSEFLKEHIHSKLHDKVNDLSDEEIHELGNWPFAEQFDKLLEIRPTKKTQGKVSTAICETNAQVSAAVCETNAQAALRLMGIARAVPFKPSVRNAENQSCRPIGTFEGEDVEDDPWHPQCSDWSAPPQAKPGEWDRSETAENRDSSGRSRDEPHKAQEAHSKHKKIDGLRPWLEELLLIRHAAAIEAWCEEMGAVTLFEVAENSEDLADTLIAKNSLGTVEKRRCCSAK